MKAFRKNLFNRPTCGFRSNPEFSNVCLNMSEVMASCTASIEKLPDEIICIIASYLNKEDIEHCFNVCRRWRYIFNSNKIWKICCLYPEKYLKNYNLHLKKHYRKRLDQDACLWKQYYDCQTSLWKNWSTGKFKKKKTGIEASNISTLYTYLDEWSNHWLFANSNNGIFVWNITGKVSLQSVLQETDQTGVRPLKDKLISYSSDYIKVFQFTYPHFKLELQYRFIFTMDDILPENQVVSDCYYNCSMRYIMVGNIFVGYPENVTNLHLPVLHMWDLESVKKIATVSVFQQSFADFVFSQTGTDVFNGFEGGLILFEGDLDHFLITLIYSGFCLCQISLYSLVQMKFVNIIAQVKSRTAWCFMKENIVAIYHARNGDQDLTGQISVYNIKGQFLAKLDFPYSYNPVFTGHFCFSASRVILKVESEIHVLSIKNSREIFRHTLNVDKKIKLLKFFEPKYLLLCTDVKNDENNSFQITVWDIESGVQLWNQGKIKFGDLNTYRHFLENTDYPGKLVLRLKGDRNLSILNFEI